MPMSMTGFGRGVVEAPFGRLIVEIQSINRKHFEVQAYLPRELYRFEHEIRKWVAEAVLRGQVVVRVQLTPSREAVLELLPDVETLQSVKSAWEKRSIALGWDPKDVDLSFVVQQVPSMQKIEWIQESDLPFLRKGVDMALRDLLSMKLKEGKVLIEDIVSRLQTIKNLASSISEASALSTDRMRQKLLEKMALLLPEGALLDERIAKEVALFAEKVDIVEELIRLNSHFSQFEECVRSEGVIGRKMDFVIQEMGREINTIGSKCCESQISYLVVEMKTELERVREQVQNIE